MASKNIIGNLAARVSSLVWPPDAKPCYPFLSALAGTGRPADQLIGLTLGLVVGSSVNLAQAAVNVVDFYLDDAHAAERAQIVKLVNMNDQKSTDLLRGYVREAMSTKNHQFTLMTTTEIIFRAESSVRWTLEASSNGRNNFTGSGPPPCLHQSRR